MIETIQRVIPSPVKPFLDVAAIFVWINAIAGSLTTLFGLLAAICSFIWALSRALESKLVQNWLKRRKEK